MKISHRATALALALAGAATGASAASFASTSDLAAWTVSTAVLNGAGDGQLASFDASQQQAAAAMDGRPGWISNVPSGTNGFMEDWTFFVFQQSFTLTAEEAATFDLKFTWAADDSGQNTASRGSWVPKYAVNGGALQSSSWVNGYTYDMSALNDVSGFHEGINTISFYVEGNGVTDGMALNVVSFAPSVPEPGSLGMLAAGLGLMGVVARRAKRQG